MRYPKKVNLHVIEHRKIFLECLGKYFQIILVELGRNHLNDDDEAKHSKPFKIPSGCYWTTLGEVIEFTSNLNIQSKFSPDTKINYVDIDAIDNKQYCIREVKERTVSELSSRARRVLKKGFMVYSLVRPYLNNLAIVEYDKEHFIGSTGFAVFKGTKLKNEFLKLLLLSEYVRQRFFEMLSGFNSPTITLEQFVQTPVPFVPKALQVGIIEFLSDLEKNEIKEEHVYFDKEVEEKIISLHSAQLIGSKLLDEIVTQEETLQLIRQTILQEAVQGKLTKQDSTDEPAIELLKRIKAEKEKLLKAGTLKKEKEPPPISEDEFPYKLPENWVACRFIDLCSTITQGPNPKYNTQVSSEYRVLKTKDFYDDKILYNKCDEVGKEIFNEWQRFELKNGDIIFGLVGKGSTGKCNIFECQKDRKYIFTRATGLFRLINQDLVLPSFIKYFFNSALGHLLIDEITDGSTGQLVIKTSEIKLLPIGLPPITEQQRIVAKVQQLQHQLSELEAQVQQSKQYAQQFLQSVLREAFDLKPTLKK